MGLFDRKNNVDPVSTDDLYQDIPRDRTSVAWLLAALSLMATMAVFVGAYFGVRAIYNNTKNKRSTEIVSVNSSPTPAPKPTTTPNSTPDSNVDLVSTQTTSTVTTKVLSPTPTPAPTQTPEPTPTPLPITTQAQSKQETKLANTGSGGITIVVFLSTTAIAAYAHSWFSRRKYELN